MPASYYGDVIRQRAKTVAEWAERMHSAEPPTEDDVTVLLDGRRLDSKESVEHGSKRWRPFGYWKQQPMMLPGSGPPLDLNRLLEVLTRNDVDFVVVGGSAAGFLGRRV